MKQKAAVSIYLVTIVLMGVLMIATAISSFMLLRQRMSIETGLSTQAYQAADTGAEWALYQINKNCCNNSPCTCTLPDLQNNNPGIQFQCSQEGIAVGNCSYCLNIISGADGTISTVTSIGTCGGVARAIELTF